MNGDERTELSALRAEVRALTATVNTLSVKFDYLTKSAEDREARLRGLEKWKNALPVATLTFLGTTSVALVALFMRG